MRTFDKFDLSQVPARHHAVKSGSLATFPGACSRSDLSGYSFANFDMNGRVTVRIVSKRSLRITVENCILWCDRARIFLLGHESRAEFMRNVMLRNLDIIHFTMTPFLFEPGEDMRLENIRVEEVRIHGEGQAELLRLKPVVNQYMQKKVPGFIRDVRFKNIVVTGRLGAYAVKLAGADPEHDARDVTFENVSILGTDLTRNAPHVNIGSHVGEIRFAGPPAETSGIKGSNVGKTQ